MKKDDLRHADELGNLKDTKYWLKRDLGTMKMGLKKTIYFSPIIFLTTLLFSVLANYIDQTLTFVGIMVLAVILLPIFCLGFFLFYIIVNKGYNIHTKGTVIDRARSTIDQE